MDFTLTDEHKLIAKSAADFGKRKIAPDIKKRDETANPDFNILKEMGKEGFLGICLPEKYGGQGADYISLGLLCLEFEKIDTSARVVLSVHTGLNSLSLLQWGDKKQKEKYLIPQARGEQIAGFGLTEPNAGSDVAGIKTTAKKIGNHYILNGEKNWISLAGVADSFLVFAYTDKSKKHKGISAFIVERNFEGISTSTIKGKLGVRAGNTGSIALQDAKIPEENLLGNEGDGFKIAMSAIDNGRFTVAAGAIGIIEACLEASIKYAKERDAFGKEIGKHQLIQQMIAKMSASKEIGYLLMCKAGWLKNQGIRNTKETSLAKWINCNNAFDVANDALQIFGAYGYSNEFDIERHFRNARGALIYEGTREIHTL
ncbi:MAG: acyl-CoA dehydrogenase family protein, partial [Candidatus Melainabacteria bacterium]|nr:acyl-CoA dehydrogenase family protein [Candidatus Melainabacteria bacterium]